MAKSKPRTKTSKTKVANNYRHPESESPMRPEVGTQAQFKKKLPPKTYRYDSSLSPSLDWDGKNSAREQGEALIQQTLDAKTLEEAKSAASKLKAMSKPFLNWAGKAERLSFDVPTLPLFIHERLSTKAILETLKGHRFDQSRNDVRPVRRPTAFIDRPSAPCLRISGQVGQPNDFGRLARGDELASSL